MPGFSLYRIVILIAFLLSGSISFAQNDVYVSDASGSDVITCGSIGSPCQTIQYAVDSIAIDGDTVRIDTGVYSLPSSTSAFAPVVKLPEGKSLNFIGSTLGQGTRVNGDSLRRGFLYFYSGTGCNTGSANDGIADTLIFSFKNLIIEDCKISEYCGSTTYAYGGGMRLDCDTGSALHVFISQCIFRRNQAYDNPGTFAGGRSASGGAIFIFGRRDGGSTQGTYAEAHIDRCDFTENSADQKWNGGHGGAVLLRMLDTASVTNSSFCSNYCYSQSADNGDLQHDRNAGGAICFYEPFNSTPTHNYLVDNCTFINNSATTNGGASYTYHSEGGAIFLTRGDGLTTVSNSTVTISNSNFYNNFIETGIEHVDKNSGTIDTTSIGFNAYYGQFDVDLGNDTNICLGDTLLLNAQIPGGIYEWQDGSSGSSFSVYDSGTYSVTVTVGSCTVSDTIEIGLGVYPVVQLGNDTTLCPYDSLELDVTTPNAVYNWSTGDTTASILYSDSGEVWVEVSVNGCAGTDTIVVDTINIWSNVLQPDTIICVGDSLPLNAQTANATYTWQDGSTAPSFLVADSGTYSVTITVDVCSVSDTIEVELQAYPVIDLGNDTSLCPLDSLTLDATTSNASYAWSTGETTSSIVYADSGQVWVEVTVNGCMTNDTINVDTINIWYNLLDPDTTLCPKATMTISAFVNGGAYVWSNGSTQSSYFVDQPDSIWVNVVKEGCAVSDTIVIDYYEPVSDIIGDDQIACDQDTITLQVSTPNLNSITWSNGQSDSVRYITVPGVYAVTIDQYGCLYSDSIEAVFKPLPVVDLGPDTSACDGTVIWFDVYNDGATYLWSYSNYASPFFPAAISGTYTVTVTQDGCTVVDEVEVEIKPIPKLDLDKDVLFCEGDSFELKARGPNGASYLWSDGSDDDHLLVYDQGIYGVTVSKNGCSRSDSTSVEVFQFPEIDLGPDRVVCEGQSVLLDPGLSGVEFLWQDGSTDSVFNASEQGKYWVLVSAGICGAADTFKLTTKPLPALRRMNDTVICEGDTFSYRQVDSNTIYLWNGQFNASRYLVEEEGYYYVKAYNDCGTKTDSAYVEVRECECHMYIPNAFSPYRDQRNDAFGVKHTCEIERFKVFIYDRWGSLLFQSEDPDFAWDGTVNGRRVPVGVYTYSIEYRAYLGVNAKKPTPFQERGMINVLR